MASTATSSVSPNSGSTVSIKGSVISHADFYFDGHLEGPIQAVHSLVTLGPNARVTGDIRARRIVVDGVVRGNLLAVEQIALGKNSRLEGNLATARISIQDGAYFKGRVDMRQRGAGKSTKESTALEQRYSALIEAKYGRGLTVAEQSDLDSVYASLIAHDEAFYELTSA